MKFCINDQTIDGDAIPKLFTAYIAAARAKYYADLDASRSKEPWEKVFTEEYRHALRDPSEIKEWLANNMDLEDIAESDVEVLPFCDCQDPDNGMKSNSCPHHN